MIDGNREEAKPSDLPGMVLGQFTCLSSPCPPLLGALRRGTLDLF